MSATVSEQTLTEQQVGELSVLLCACVDEGASVGFLAPADLAQAQSFWRGVAEDAAGGHVFAWTAREDGHLLGVVLLRPALMPNQPHRGDVSKLLVHPVARRRGLGRLLMQALEAGALERGRTLLVLDTAGAAAEALYALLGWRRVGVIPAYALDTAGKPEATVVYYRDLRTA